MLPPSTESPGGLDRWWHAHAWAGDSLLALAATAVLGVLTVSALQGAELSSEPALVLAFGGVHVSVAFRRTAPMAAYAVACLGMLAVVAMPDVAFRAAAGQAGQVAQAGQAAQAPPLFLPSSLAFALVLSGAGAVLPRRWARAALVIALAGSLLAAVRAGGAARAAYSGSLLVPFYVAVVLVLTVLATWSLGRFRASQRVRAEADRAEVTRLAVLRERAAIARDMHDIVAHSLAVIVRQAEGGAYAASHAPDQAAGALRAIAGTGREALEDMRGVLGVLRDPDREAAGEQPQPGLADLPALLDRVRAAGLAVDYTETGLAVPLGPAGELAAFRTVQEALTNTVKHAGTHARATVRLDWQDEAAVVAVRDDRGGEPDRQDGGDPVPGAGAGLAGLRARVSAVGGTLEAEALGPGFGVRARVPQRRA